MKVQVGIAQPTSWLLQMQHGLCLKPQDWPFSSVHRFIAQGLYPRDWVMIETPVIPDNIGDE